MIVSSVTGVLFSSFESGWVRVNAEGLLASSLGSLGLKSRGVRSTEKLKGTLRSFLICWKRAISRKRLSRERAAAEVALLHSI
jgi:hypothetical protein